MTSYSWRKATLDDIDTLVRHRREMFSDLGRPLCESIGYKATNEMRVILAAGSG